MLHPFDTIKDKVDSVINYLKLSWYWEDDEEDKIHALDKVLQDSLLGQAIRLLAAPNYYCFCDDIDLALNIDLQELPVVFGDLVILYMNAGYNVKSLKDFIIELYQEYYPETYPSEKDQPDEKENYFPHITEEDLDVEIRQNLFDFLEFLILEYRKDIILTGFLYHTPNRELLRENVNLAKDQWLEGVCDYTADEIMLHTDQSGDIIKYYPIIDTSIIFKMANQKNKEFESMMHEQLEGVTSRAIRECNLFPDSEDFKDTIIDNAVYWRRAILKKTDTLMIELMIHHSENLPVPEEFRINDNDEYINGSLLRLRVSIIDK